MRPAFCAGGGGSHLGSELVAQDLLGGGVAEGADRVGGGGGVAADHDARQPHIRNLGPAQVLAQQHVLALQVCSAT